MRLLRPYDRRISINHNMVEEEHNSETQPLLGTTEEAKTFICTRKRLLLVAAILLIWGIIISTLVVNFFVVSPSIPAPADDKVLDILSLSVWGSPHSFGTEDKEERITAIGEFISNRTDVDVFLLQELWMRPDHNNILTIIQRNRKDLMMTTVGELAPTLCDGRAAPTFCSGLAAISKFPIKDVSFTEFSAHGYIFYKDGEYWARKGTGRIRIEPAKNYTVDIFFTSTCAYDYNTYYRQIQAKEFAQTVSKSSADFIIAGGNFNIDPRTSETTYRSVAAELTDSRKEYYGERWLNPLMSTYGNKENSYSHGATSLVYDYFWHKAQHGNSVKVKKFSVPILKTAQGHSFSNHEATRAGFALIKPGKKQKLDKKF